MATVKVALSSLIGRKIVSMRLMTQKEKNERGWYRRNPVVILKLEGGVELYPQRDEEGNDGGCLIGLLPDGGEFYVSNFMEK